MDRHRAAVRLAGGRRSTMPAVVRHVEPFVRVGGPAVRALGAVDEVREARAAPPPRARRRRRRAARRRRPRPRRRSRRTGRTRPVFTSPAWAQTIVGPSLAASASRSASGRIRPWSSAATGSSEPVPRPMKPQRARRRSSAPSRPRARGSAARRSGPSRSTSQPTCAQHVVARGGERGRVGHLRAGHERERRSRGSPSRSASQAPADLLDDGRGRAGDVQPGVLVPGRGQPVGGERRGHGTADHEPEVPPARDRDGASLPDGGELGARPRADRSVRRAPARPAAPAAPRGRRCGNTGRSGS